MLVNPQFELSRNRSCANELLGMDTDWEPLEKFWRRWRGAGLQVARRFANARDADDLLSEAMFRLTRRYARGKVDYNTLWPYLCQIIHRLAIDKYRKRHLQECEYRLDADPRIYEDQYQNGDEAEITAILGTVKPPYREAMICVDIHEMSYEEASTFLGTKVGTIRSRLHRGRVMARSAMEKMLAERRKVIQSPRTTPRKTFQ